MINNELIIRSEAKRFVNRTINFKSGIEAVVILQKIKKRLTDFYSLEFKSIFLDEVKNNVIDTLIKQRENEAARKIDSEHPYEQIAQTLLFYINQEIGFLPTIAYQKKNLSSSREKVFVSYSHADKAYLEDVKKHFKPFLTQIDFWDDTKIQPGQKWKDEIRKAIEQTKIAILLVSADFLASDFISTKELPSLLKTAERKGAVILIVILKPCLFEEFADLNQYQSMNPPYLPLSKMNLNEKEELYVNLVRQKKKILTKK